MSPVETTRRVMRGARRPANWMQLLKFGFVGGSGYVVNLTVYALAVRVAHIHYLPAAVVAFIVAVSNNFYWNRHWTFRAGEGHAGFQAARFFAVSVVGLAVNLIALELLVQGGMAKLPAQALAVAIAMPLNFIGNKLWTFS